MTRRNSASRPIIAAVRGPMPPHTGPSLHSMSAASSPPFREVGEESQRPRGGADTDAMPFEPRGTCRSLTDTFLGSGDSPGATSHGSSPDVDRCFLDEA